MSVMLPPALLAPSVSELATHRTAMLRFARRKIRDEALAEDTVQDALLAALTHIDRFQGQSALRTWLIGILNHKIQDAFRRETRYVSLDQNEDSGDSEHFNGSASDALNDGTTYAIDPMKQVSGFQIGRAIERSIAALPDTLRDVFQLQALEGIETSEVCRRLNISEANCWVRLHRARKRLATDLRDHAG